MRRARALAICAHELRLARREASSIALSIVLPVVLILFLRPASQAILVQDGVTGANGAELAVPGMAVMFSFFVVGTVGFAFFRDHGWHTWDRLRASSATSAEIAVGKGAFGLIIVSLQLACVFAAGVVLYGYRPNGSVLGVVLVAGSLAVFVVAFGLFATALCRTVQQLNLVSTVGAIVLGGLGGALIPLAALPGWMQAVAPAIPTYWAMQGFEAVSLEAGGVGSAVGPCAVLWAFTALALAGAVWRFRFDDTKVSWA